LKLIPFRIRILKPIFIVKTTPFSQNVAFSAYLNQSKDFRLIFLAKKY